MYKAIAVSGLALILLSWESNHSSSLCKIPFGVQSTFSESIKKLNIPHLVHFELRLLCGREFLACVFLWDSFLMRRIGWTLYGGYSLHFAHPMKESNDKNYIVQILRKWGDFVVSFTFFNSVHNHVQNNILIGNILSYV